MHEGAVEYTSAFSVVLSDEFRSVFMALFEVTAREALLYIAESVCRRRDMLAIDESFNKVG